MKKLKLVLMLGETDEKDPTNEWLSVNVRNINIPFTNGEVTYQKAYQRADAALDDALFDMLGDDDG